MTKRIFHSICIVALVVFLASMLLIMGALYDYFNLVQRNQLKSLAEVSAHSLYVEGPDFIEQIDASRYRLTWIAADGEVLYDSVSDTSGMENHLEREEIREAMENGIGESSRYSSTMMERQLYAAVLVEDGTILRLSCEQYTILTLLLGMLQPIAIVIAAALCLSLYLAYRLSRYIVQPLNNLNLNEPLSNMEYEELSPLLRRIDTQQQQLKLQSAELQRMQDEFETATANMNEGLVLLGKKGTILSMNPAASTLLGIEKRYIGYSLRDLNPAPEIAYVLDQAHEGCRAEKILTLNSREYQLDASPILTDNQVSGIALLLFDVTEKERTEQIRREFTANVSHELKTPLHAISGYAELIANNMVRTEDIAPFAEKIYAEAQRMTNLVEDILHLSHLDEGGADMQWAEVDLYAICLETAAQLSSSAELADVKLTVEGQSAPYNGIPQLLHSIFFNLCDNAIKYNHPGGEVRMVLTEEENSFTVTVSDTGIGIPEEHLDRIFERFYRVDKSHSKDVGGTGLGLSIVKHAAIIHNAHISVVSRIGEGTAITVVFPKKSFS